MKFNLRAVGIVAIALIASLTLAMFSGCGNKDNNVSGSDVKTNAPTEPSLKQLGPEVSVEAYVGETKVEDFFLLSYTWNGESYKSDDSLNKTMMMKYISDDSAAPHSANGTEITFKFKWPDQLKTVRLSQIANTFKASSKIPFDIDDLQLTKQDNGDRSFKVDFEKYDMYYYKIYCEWEGGFTAEYAFALVKS